MCPPSLFFRPRIPIPASAKVAAYWAAIQTNEHAARTLVELHRGLEERRELIRTGAFDKMMAAARAAMAAAEAEGVGAT